MHSEVSFCGLPKEIRLSILEYNEFDLWTFAPINKSIRQDVAFLKAQKPPTDIVDPTQRWNKSCIEGGISSVLRLLEDQVPMSDTHNPICFAVHYGHSDLVTLLLDKVYRDKARIPEAAMNNAASRGFLDIVQRLHRAGATCSATAMNNAAINGHLPTVQWLFENNLERCAKDIDNRVARNGHLEVLKFLKLHNLTNGCTKGFNGGMEDAAEGGHLEVVQWLFQERRISAYAIVKAGLHGHLPLLKWLHKHIQPNVFSLPWEVMKNAVSNDNLDLVKWLIENRREEWFSLTELVQPGLLSMLWKDYPDRVPRVHAWIQSKIAEGALA